MPSHHLYIAQFVLGLASIPPPKIRSTLQSEIINVVNTVSVQTDATVNHFRINIS